MTAVLIAFGYNRLFSLRHFLYRWRGQAPLLVLTHRPVLLAIHISSLYQATVLHFINTHHFPSRLTTLLFVTTQRSTFSNLFPINRLRNLAIYNLRTTHFLMLDMDVRVSRTVWMGGLWVVNTYDELMTLPSFVYKGDHNAVILPLFFHSVHNILQFCNTPETCAYLCQFCHSLSCRTAAFQPETKAELIECIHSGVCSSSRGQDMDHNYVMPEWFVTSPSAHVSRIRCFVTDRMQPFMMMKLTQDMIMYNPQFFNYGYNRIAYFENVRQAGYSFFILNNAFAIDSPHSK